MKTFKHIREEAEKATKAKKIRNRRDASWEMERRAKQNWFRRAIKRAMLKPPSPDTLDDRASRKQKKLSHDKYGQGQKKYKDATFAQRQNKDDRLDKKLKGKDKALEMAKKKLEKELRKDAIERAKRLRANEREKRISGKK